MLLANLARMDKDGKYVIDMLQEDGNRRPIELQELSNKQIETLIELQKSGPKSLEEIQKRQLDTQTLMGTNIAAIKDRLTLGLASGQSVIELQETMRRLGYAVTKDVEEKSKEKPFNITTEGVRGTSGALFEGIQESVKKVMKGETGAEVALAEAMAKLTTSLQEKAEGGMQGIPKDIPKLLSMIQGEGAKLDELMRNQGVISGTEMTDEMKKRQQEQRRAQRELKQAEQRINQIINNQSLTQYYSTGIQGRQFSQQALMPSKIDVNVTGGQITKIELTGSPELIKAFSNMNKMSDKEFQALFTPDFIKSLILKIEEGKLTYTPRQ
jgi:hypothetical protein